MLIYRVANLSYKIAKQCTDCGDVRIAYIGGLVHDVLDSKLITSNHDKELIENELRSLLLNKEKCSDEQVDVIVNIVKSVGYSKRLKTDYHTNKHLFSKEYKAVQDADLLDAIGCIGIARCYSFGGKKGNTIFGVSDGACEDISYDYYVNKGNHAVHNEKSHSTAIAVSTNSSTEHFFEKLLRIKSLLITPLGKEMGLLRHHRMVQYLTWLKEELVEGVEDVSTYNDTDGNSVEDERSVKRRRKDHVSNMDKVNRFS